MRKSLTKQERIVKNKDYRNLFKSGTWISGKNIKLVHSHNDLDYSRFGISLNRRYGNAVARNRIKRVIKEILRLYKGDIKVGYDIVLVLYRGQDHFDARRLQLRNVFGAGNLLQKDTGVCFL